MRLLFAEDLRFVGSRFWGLTNKTSSWWHSFELGMLHYTCCVLLNKYEPSFGRLREEKAHLLSYGHSSDH